MTHLHSSNKSRIAILFGVVAMPFLCALVSCGGEKKEIVDVGFDPNNSYTMKATQIVTMVSDSGITRYKVVTAEWLMFDEAEEPYWFFPEKVHLEKFDSLFRVEASVDADTAYYYKRKELWKLSGNVRVKNLEGEQFETELLFWDEQGKKIYSDHFIRITKNDFVNTGMGFESNLTLTQYRIFTAGAEIPLETNKARADTMKSDPPSLP